MQIDIKRIASDLKVSLPDLITRPVGRRMYEKVKKTLSVLHEDELMVMDFKGVKVVDSSFIDEFLLRLILESRSSDPPYFVKLRNISEAIEINCESVFSSYCRFNSERVAVITDGITGNNSVYLGALSKTERDIIDYLRVNKIARVPEIAEFIGEPEAEAAVLADGLYSLRVVRRQKDDGNFRYGAL